MTNDPTQRGPLLHQIAVPVRWGDMDALGHVNNIIYLQYFEECRVEWKAGLGYPTSAAHEGMIVKKVAATYHRAVVWPATLDIKMYAGQVGRTSFGLHHELRVAGAGDEVWTEADVLVVWFDYAKGRPIPVPDSMHLLLGARIEA